MKKWILNLFCAAVVIAALACASRAADTVLYNFALPPADGTAPVPRKLFEVCAHQANQILCEFRGRHCAFSVADHV